MEPVIVIELLKKGQTISFITPYSSPNGCSMECIFFFWFALCLGWVKPVRKLRRQQSALVLFRSLVPLLVVIEQLQGRVRNLSGPNHSICRHCSPWEWVTVLNIHKTQARHRHRRASPDQHLCLFFIATHSDKCAFQRIRRAWRSAWQEGRVKPLSPPLD